MPPNKACSNPDFADAARRALSLHSKIDKEQNQELDETTENIVKSWLLIGLLAVLIPGLVLYIWIVLIADNEIIYPILLGFPGIPDYYWYLCIYTCPGWQLFGGGQFSHVRAPSAVRQRANFKKCVDAFFHNWLPYCIRCHWQGRIDSGEKSMDHRAEIPQHAEHMNQPKGLHAQ